MASAKLATLIIRTLAKPISSQIKEQARQHERFRGLCVNLAQFMYRSEVKLRTNILGEPAKHIRPLSEVKAIDNGANALAEGFLFTVAAALIIGETWRSSRNQSKRRDTVDDQLEDLGVRISELTTRVDEMARRWEEERGAEQQRNDELARILERVVDIGLRGGWAEFQDTPVQLPRVQLAAPALVQLRTTSLSSSPSSPSSPSSSSPLSSFSPSSSSSSPPSQFDTPDTDSATDPFPTPIAQTEPASVFVSASLPEPPPSSSSSSSSSSPSFSSSEPKAVLTAGSASAPAPVVVAAPPQTQTQGKPELKSGTETETGSVVQSPHTSARPKFRIVVRPRHPLPKTNSNTRTGETPRT